MQLTKSFNKMSKEQKSKLENIENIEYESDISHKAMCSEKTIPKIAAVPKITFSIADSDNVNKRFSTGSDYADWGHRLAKQDGGEVGKFFDGMGLERGVLEPMLSIQCANIHPASSSSINLLESASNAGCVLDTDQDNCDRRSELGLPGAMETETEPVQADAASSGGLKHRQPTPEETNNRIMQWLTTVTPTESEEGT